MKEGLAREGLADVAALAVRPGRDAIVTRITVPRRPALRGLAIFLPKVLHQVGDGWDEIDYERDLLAGLNWAALTIDGVMALDTEDHDLIRRVQLDRTEEVRVGSIPGTLDPVELARALATIVPNPWHAYDISVRVIELHLAHYAGRMGSDDAKRIVAGNFSKLAMHAETKAREWVDRQTRAIFLDKLQSGVIGFKLVRDARSPLNWALANEIDLEYTPDDQRLRRQDDSEIARSAFERNYRRDFNGLERDLAWFLDGAEQVEFWHRFVAQLADSSIPARLAQTPHLSGLSLLCSDW